MPPPPPTEAAFTDVWYGWIKAIEDKSELYFVPRLRESSRCLGIVAIHDLHSKTSELGIWLRSDVHGEGFGHELVGAVVAWRSEHSPVDYFEYPVAENNIASCRIAEAYGGEIASNRANAKYRSLVYHIPPVQLPAQIGSTEQLNGPKHRPKVSKIGNFGKRSAYRGSANNPCQQRTTPAG